MEELTLIQGKLKAPKGQYNSFGKYHYRSCEDILESVKPLLQEFGCQLTIADEMVQVSDRIYVKAVATIKNKAGESETTTAFAREEETKKGMDGSQVTGAASSYARKYALNGLFCIDDTKDSDATNIGDTAQKNDVLPSVLKKIKAAKDLNALSKIYNDNAALHTETKFMNALTEKKKEINAA